MDAILRKKGFICDMDGVIYHGSRILDGVADFVNWMIDSDKKFIFLTNSAERTPHELSMKLARMGLQIPPENFYTSAMATAEFLHSQNPGSTDSHEHLSRTGRHLVGGGGGGAGCPDPHGMLFRQIPQKIPLRIKKAPPSERTV